MPELIRAKCGGRVHRWIGGLRSLAFATGLLAATPATADDDTTLTLGAALLTDLASVERHEYAALALTLGIVVFAVVTAIMLLRARSRAAAVDSTVRGKIASLEGAVDRANTLLQSDPQVLVVWPATSGDPDIIGDLSIVGAEELAARVLAFSSWLDHDAAQAMTWAVETLRTDGHAFSMSLVTITGRHIEAEGRAVGGRALLRLRDVSGITRRLAEMASEQRKLQGDVEALRVLAEALPSPVWVRDQAGRLAFVNSAYARAVDAASPDAVLAGGTELLDHEAREELRFGNAGGVTYARRRPVIVAGKRRVLDVLSIPTVNGSAGIGIDVTEAEAMRGEVARMVEAHRRTLDQLATGVAIFDSERRLSFYNAAYRALWDLDAAFLDQTPTDSVVLEHLRAARRLPEQQDFRQWRLQLHEAYAATEARQHEWHLPDGRTLRVVTSPNPDGGVTYLFEDVTERLDLERKFDVLIRGQGETLDNLGEGVAVFGSDGRLRLFNPAFARMWRLETATLSERPHIEAVIGWCRRMYGADDTWQALRVAVTTLDARAPLTRRIERTDGSVLDCATVPLPDGATLITFTDVTASVNVERALVERNEALVAADELKVNFLQHVSYELRSPLTNIIGFAHFLGDPTTGPMNERQGEYLGYITSSTNALLAIINNILDLATIDAGAMTLDLGPVDILSCMKAAAEGVQDRLVKDEITLDLRSAGDIGRFVADERRVRQVLFNLLSNAIGFSPKGGAVTLAAERQDGAVVFSVSDQGPGIPADMTDKVFDSFESNPLGSRHRGVGLGLSLVRSFVELHGGTVRIDSAVGRGTTVVCIFPLDQAAARTAAE